MTRIMSSIGIAIGSLWLSGCGTYVPLKDPLHPNTLNSKGLSREGRIESNIVANIRCEVQNAIYDADRLGSVPYLSKWGTQVTLKLTWDEMASLSPNISIMDPLPSMQSFTLGLGGSGSAHATRLETVTFLWENSQLLSSEIKNRVENPKPDCSKLANGIMIESDLRIGEFIYDQATLSATKIATTKHPVQPQFSTFQEDITFVASLSGNITPTWKLTRISANTNGNFASATRTTTGDVLITLGPLTKDRLGKPIPQLADPAASQHTAGVIGGSVASQIMSQSR